MSSAEPQASVVPGEILFGEGDIEINAGDRPVQVGSHVHLAQANAALAFDRDVARGHRFDIPAGTAVRFEPGVPQRVTLVPLAGTREVHGVSLYPPGRLGAR